MFGKIRVGKGLCDSQKIMNIAIVHTELSKIGGSQRQALALALELKRLGHQTTVYAVRYDKEKCFPEMCRRLNIVALNPAQKNRPEPKGRFQGLALFFRERRRQNDEARKLALMIDPATDIVNAHNLIGFRTAAFFKRSIKDAPSVLMMNDILTKSWSAWRKSNFNPDFKLTLRRRIFYRLVDWYDVWRYIKCHDAITVLDERTRDFSGKYFKNLPVFVVRSGVEISEFPFSERVAPVRENFSLLAVGIFFMHRRYEDIIRAVKILRDDGYGATLDIIGGFGGDFGPYYRKLFALVSELGLWDRVNFLGKVSEEELKAVYRSRHIYVSANHLQSWGLAVFEAMASGIPTIVSRTAGASEVLTDGENALLVPPKSPEKIAEAVKRCVDDPVFYGKIVKTAREFVSRNISWNSYAAELLKIFQDLAGRSRY